MISVITMFTIVIVSSGATCFAALHREKMSLTVVRALHDFDILICRRLQAPRKVNVKKLIGDIKAYADNMYILLDLIELKRVSVSVSDSICKQNGPLFLQIPVNPIHLYSGFRILPSTVKPLIGAFYRAKNAWKVFYYWMCVNVEQFKREMAEYISG